MMENVQLPTQSTSQQEPSIPSEPHVQPWVVILLILFLQPVAWYFMYRDKRYHSWFPYLLWVISVPVIIVNAILLLFVVPQLLTLYNQLNVSPPMATTSYLGMYASIVYSLIVIAFGIFLLIRVRKFGMLSKPLLWITIVMLALNVVAMGIGQATTITSIILPIYNLTNAINEPPSAPQPTSTPVDETANWKTYTNSKFGYSFQYPPTLSVSNCPSNDCGEIIYYPKAPGKGEIDEDNTLVDIALIGGKYCQYENKFKDGTNPKKASLQAQCDLPGVSTANDPILPVIDEQTTNTANGLSQYSFYLRGYQNNKIGPFYAFFFSKPAAEMNINKDLVTYYGVYWTPNRFKPLTSDKMPVFDQILSTFKFTQ